MAAVNARGIQRVSFDLADLKRGSHTREVAHTQSKEHYVRLTRHLGNLVLILTALTGTAVVAALAASTGTAAKVVIGVFSVSAAVAAALNQRGPYGDLVKRHATAASSFSALNGEVRTLDRKWSLGKLNLDEADRQLRELEASYDDLEKKSPDVRDYEAAHCWVKKEEQDYPGPPPGPSPYVPQ
jgi:hypothetical protein